MFKVFCKISTPVFWSEKEKVILGSKKIDSFSFLRVILSSVGTSDPKFNWTWWVELNFKFFWVKALKTFQLSSRVGSKQQFWHQLFSTWVIFKFKKINFFQVNSRKSWKNLNLIKWQFYAAFNHFMWTNKIVKIKYFFWYVWLQVIHIFSFLKKLRFFQLFLELTWKSWSFWALSQP